MPIGKRKSGLWTFLSAATDDAASKCYQHVQEFAKNLTDVDTCTISSLKSIAQSTGLSYLTDNIPVGFPLEVEELLNKLSLPKRTLLNDSSESDILSGKIAQRSAAEITTKKIPVNLLKEVKNHIADIKTILNMNMVFTKQRIPGPWENADGMLDQILKIQNEDLTNYTTDNENNPFFTLIRLIKKNLHNTEYDYYLETSYYDKANNATIDLKWLFAALINTILSDDDSFTEDFVAYHFAELIRSKLKNNRLLSLFRWNNKKNEFQIIPPSGDLMSLTEFAENTADLITESERAEFIENSGLNLEPVLCNDLVEYVKYLRMVNDHCGDQLEWDNTLKYLFPKYFTNGEEVVSKFEQYISYVSRWLGDEARRISTVRERIKGSIQQFNLIGTKRIATDILYDFFLDNYSEFSTKEELINGGFEINIKEYSDRTNYTNIEADAGLYVSGKKVIGTDESVKYSIDNDGLITSSVVSSEIYEQVYSPVLATIKDSNPRFWENSSTIDLSPYRQYLSEVANESDKSLSAFLGRVWDVFALSGWTDGESDSLRSRFIRNPSNGKIQYQNNANTAFPTIDPLPFISEGTFFSQDNTSQLNILDVTIGFYSYVVAAVDINLFELFDKNGVPDNGWRHGQAIYHGYSSNYESTAKTDKTQFHDGPFEYSKLQDILYSSRIIGWGKLDYASLAGNDDSDGRVRTLLKMNLQDTLNDTADKKFVEIQTDENDSVYSLSEDGIIYFRKKDMPFSLKLADFLGSGHSNVKKFGVFNNLIWQLYSEDDLWTYEVSLIGGENGVPKTSEIIYSRMLHFVNDFVCSYYDFDLDELVAVFFNSMEQLLTLDPAQSDLTDLDLQLDVVKIFLDGTVKTQVVSAKHCPFPAFLKHNERPDYVPEPLNRFIWKSEKYGENLGICYESLNVAIPSAFFDYYFKYGSSSYYFETLLVVFSDLETLSLDNNQYDYSYKILVKEASVAERCKVFAAKNQQEIITEEKIVSTLAKYPYCNKEGKQKKTFITPFSTKTPPSTDDLLIIAKNCYNSGETDFTFEYVLEHFAELTDGVSDPIYLSSLKSQLEYIISNREKLKKEILPEFVFSDSDAENLTVYDLMKGVPALSICSNNAVKVVVWFKNDSGVSFIHDYALDLDLSCKVVDYENSSKKVGYWGGFTSTKYLTWSGDSTSGDHESIEINYKRYSEDYPSAKTMTVDLGVCWHETTEIVAGEVVVSVIHNDVKQDINIDVDEFSRRDCKSRSIVFQINLEDSSVHYEIPKTYALMTVNFKNPSVGYSDGKPDVICEFKSWISSEFGGGLEWINPTDEYIFRKVSEDSYQVLKKTPVPAINNAVAYNFFHEVFVPSKFLPEFYSDNILREFTNPARVSSTLEAVSEGKFKEIFEYLLNKQ